MMKTPGGLKKKHPMVYTSPMTIITPYVSSRYRTGGQKRHLELIHGLASRGHRIYLIKDKKLDLPLSASIEVGNLTVPNGPSRDRSFARAIETNLVSLQSVMADKESDEDLLILQWGESSVFTARFLQKKTGSRLITALRNNWVLANELVRDTWPKGIKTSALKTLHARRDINREKLISQTTDHLVFQSMWDRDAFLSRQSFPDKDISIIPNSIRAAWFDPAYRQTNHSKKLEKICFIGNEDPRKGLEFLLEAFSQLRKEYPRLSLDVMGRYPEKLIQEYRSRKLTSGVTFTGVQPSTLPALQKADLFIIPSLYDSFPNTLLEALFVGAPSCGSKTAGIIDMLDDKEILFTPGSAKDIENQLRKWLNPDFYNQKAAHCRTRAQNYDFDWTTRWEKILLN